MILEDDQRSYIFLSRENFSYYRLLESDFYESYFWHIVNETSTSTSNLTPIGPISYLYSHAAETAASRGRNYSPPRSRGIM